MVPIIKKQFYNFFYIYLLFIPSRFCRNFTFICNTRATSYPEPETPLITLAYPDMRNKRIDESEGVY